jgi:hypothetical protein
MIFSKYVFYILVFFGEGVLNKPRNQGSFGTFGTGCEKLKYYYLIKVLFISPTRMRASTLNFFNPPDTKLRKLKVERVISARGMNKNYNG